MKSKDQVLLEEAYTQINEVMMSPKGGSGKFNNKYYNPDRSVNVQKVIVEAEKIHKLFRNLYKNQGILSAMEKDNNISQILTSVEMKLIDLAEDLKGLHYDPADEVDEEP